MASPWNLVLGFLALALLFYSLERLFPSIREKPLWRSDSHLDLIYWFVTPLVTKSLSRLTTLVAVVIAAVLAGLEVGPGLADGFGPMARQPPWLVVIILFLLGDLIGYWVHRLFHGRFLWPVHAVHHSSRQLDWLSSVRVHPLNDIIARGFQAVPLVLLGFPLKLVAIYVPFLGLYALFLHANVSWSYGWLGHVIASPRFHRWHHTAETEGLDKNFAGLFPFWDHLFGSFHMPKDRYPKRFGTSGEPVPTGFLGQMAYPFQRFRAVLKQGRLRP